MASHHHHHHYQNHQPSSHCCCCSCTSSHPSELSQSHPNITDPLIFQAIATHLLQSSQTNLYPQHLKPQQQQKQQHQQQYYHQQKQTQSLITSLHHRIDALESSLHHLSASPSPPPLSLRDLATRTIQTHFRAHLVRRSRTLRHLKDLAFIKSCFNGLKSSISDNTHLNSKALSQKAMDLLLKLDSIQGSDPMIRDGKRSISRELVRFLEFIDEVSVRRGDISSQATKNLRFAENKKESRDFISTYGSLQGRKFVINGINSNHRDLAGDEGALLEKLNDQVQVRQGFGRVSEDDEESRVELEGFHHISDDEEIPINLDYGINETSRAQNGILVKRKNLQPKAKKSVSFAENGNISRVFTSTHEPFFSSGDVRIDRRGSIDDQRELVDNLCSEVEEIGGLSRVSEDDEEGAHMEKIGPLQPSDGGRTPRTNVKTGVNYVISDHFQAQNGNFVFSAPMPVQMEPRKDDLKGKKTVKVTVFQD